MPKTKGLSLGRVLLMVAAVLFGLGFILPIFNPLNLFPCIIFGFGGCIMANIINIVIFVVLVWAAFLRK